MPDDRFRERQPPGAATPLRSLQKPPHWRPVFPSGFAVARTARRSPQRPSNIDSISRCCNDPLNLGSTRRSCSQKLLCWKGIAASIGGIGDASDNALAETTIGLFKTEAVAQHSPFLAGPLRPSTRLSAPRSSGSTGATPADCTVGSTMSRQTNTRLPITLQPRRPSRRRLNDEAGIKPVTVQRSDAMRFSKTEHGRSFDVPQDLTRVVPRLDDS